MKLTKIDKYKNNDAVLLELVNIHKIMIYFTFIYIYIYIMRLLLYELHILQIVNHNQNMKY